MKRTELTFLLFLALPLAAFTLNPALLGEVTQEECEARCKSKVYDPDTVNPEWTITYGKITHVTEGVCTWVAGVEEPPTPAQCNESTDCEASVTCTVTMDEDLLSHSVTEGGSAVCDNDDRSICPNDYVQNFNVNECGDTEWQLLKLEPGNCMNHTGTAIEQKKIGLYCVDCPDGFLY